MVYSTCSILPKENEEIICSAMKGQKAEIVPIKFEGMESIPLLPCGIEGALCVCPNEFYEGFFVVKIKKV
jgi:16S rRNA C967 or C1407 C5-methylase (RsmB/RsmF family)